MATKTVTVASIMKSHLHDSKPRVPSRPYCMPAPTRPPKPPESRLPAYSMEVRRASSLRVYHDERRKSAPGKYGAAFVRMQDIIDMENTHTLDDTEKESHNNETSEVVHCRGETGDNAPSYHASRQVKRWAHAGQEQVGRDLQGQVAGEENRNGGVELCTTEL